MNNRMILNIKTESAYEIPESYIIKCYDKKTKYPFLLMFRLLHFLKKSHFFFPTLDMTKCIFSGKRIELSDSFYSDGEWIWSADLKHYTKNYHFIWPEEFINSIRTKRFRIKSEDTCNFEEIIDSPVFLKYTKEIMGMEFNKTGFELFIPH